MKKPLLLTILIFLPLMRAAFSINPQKNKPFNRLAVNLIQTNEKEENIGIVLSKRRMEISQALKHRPQTRTTALVIILGNKSTQTKV
jgi:hypothetical protein